jgi:hypothetical protein
MRDTRVTRITTVGAWIACALVVVASAEYSVTDIVDAAKRGDGHAVHRLIQVDPDRVAARDHDGYTALHWAAIRGHWAIVTELVAAGAPGLSPRSRGHGRAPTRRRGPDRRPQ